MFFDFLLAARFRDSHLFQELKVLGFTKEIGQIGGDAIKNWMISASLSRK